MNRDYFIKQTILLFVIIIASVLIIRYLSNGETLIDYANKNNIPVHSEKTVDEGDTEQVITEE